MIGYRFSQFVPPQDGGDPFERLLKVFMELLTHTSGDVSEALNWMNQLDRQYGLTDNEYGMGDFIEDLKKNGYIEDDQEASGSFQITAKSEQTIRQRSLEEIFGKLKRSGRGNHRSHNVGFGDEPLSELKGFEFGDSVENIAFTESFRNAQINHGIDDFQLTENDLSVREKEHRTSVSTVLMIDISHSMILYGEDRITPAKKVAMALSELILRKYPKDTLDIIVFGNDAWQIQIKDLPYLQVGPYHTNTVAGLELAMDILRRRKTTNKQIFMITDGKPTCIREGARYYKNSYGLDRKILNKTLNLGAQCRRLKIPITTFMIARDNWLVEFVQEFTRVNNGRAFYTSLQGLGEYIFEDFIRNRKKRVR
ncbi:VWA domain-containing protein [Pontibacter sp. G13]|uniref:vWA domain-containing protein n=1 Tax=Pontibacter sp. G13 TaxID=3074898 RepID=UPI00288C150E|nr:VWA domain-containing protein [Pontibacter sp. G13]WNJ21252.1 VWA domain-containing protein [Pontibacter sp. G13]